MNVSKKARKKKREGEIALSSSMSDRTDFYLRSNYKLKGKMSKKEEKKER
jgi:hypothetical protein